MMSGHGVALRPLVYVLKLTLCLPVLLSAAPAWAVPVTGPEKIDASTPVQRYEIRATGELTANGARLLQVTASPGGRLNLNTSVVETDRGAAVELIGGNAILHDSTLIGQAQGLLLGYQAGNPVSSSAQVHGGSITGQTGVLVSAVSKLSLTGTTVSGTGSNGLGLMVFGGGTVQAAGSTISGQRNGIELAGDPNRPGLTRLLLDGTQVIGNEGAAIVVNADVNPGQASVHIANGSTLVGGNGRIVEVDSLSSLDMTVDNSQLSGDVRVELGGRANLTLQNQASLTGRLENVMQLALTSQARWNMVDDGRIENLSMDNGSIKFGGADEFYRLTVENLSGNGTFLMDVDFAQAQTDFLDITGSATGSHSLLIGSTGSDPLVDTNLHVVHAAAGDASFSLAGGAVDLGTWSYDLIKQGDNDWYLDAATRKVSPGAGTAIALFNAAPTVWYGEMSTLRTRMGELRHTGAKPGVWMRAYSNRFDAEGADGVGYRQQQQGLSLGADAVLPLGDGQWLGGVMLGHSESDLNLERGSSGNIDSYYAGAYATWLDNASGYYFDGVLKINHLRNTSKVNLSDGSRTQGDYANWASGASAEFGRHIKLEQGWFVEPYAQLSTMVAQGRDYHLDNGMRAEGDNARSLLAKGGATLGREIALGQGRKVQPYVRAALAHEFVKNNEVQVNGNRFNNNLSGSRGELGLGAALTLSEAFQLHADFEYSNGSRIEQPWGANLGLRYNW